MGTRTSGHAGQSPTGGAESPAPPLGEILAQLKADFPEWSIIHTSDTGRWWANRGLLNSENPRPGRDCVDADSADELRELLEQAQ